MRLHACHGNQHLTSINRIDQIVSIFEWYFGLADADKLVTSVTSFLSAFQLKSLVVSLESVSAR